MPEATKEKLRKVVVSDETRAKMSAAAAGRKKPPRSVEHRKSISDAVAKSWENSEDSTKRVAAIKAAWTPERRAKMSEKAAELWKDPEIRAKRIAAMTKSTKQPPKG